MHQIDDCLVLDGLQRSGVDLSGLKVQTCLLQLCRAQKAADMIITKEGMFFAHEKRSFIYFLYLPCKTIMQSLSAAVHRDAAYFYGRKSEHLARCQQIRKSEYRNPRRISYARNTRGTFFHKHRLFG